MKKVVIIMAIVLIASTFSINLVAHASTTDEHITEACNYEAEPNKNPSYQMVNCLLTTTALAYDIPPEIVKAVAEGESRDWKQFDEEGNVVANDDGGIGIMQVTNKSGYNGDELKNDIVYNIRAGVEILNSMFERNDLPTINDGNRDVLENWYFAVMAYNGIKPVNSPIVQANGKPNPDAYQEKIFNNIKEFALIDPVDLPFSTKDFEYDTTSSSNIEFVTKTYDFTLPLTKTVHLFEPGQKVRAIDALTIRPNPTTSDGLTKGTLDKGEVVEITGPFEYDENKESRNHFVWYPIKRNDGTTGYVASSFLADSFHDVENDHYAEEAIYYLANRGVLQGVGDHNFGMGREITRWEVVLMLTRANNTSLENRPDPGFADVSKDHPYYNEIAAAADEGIFQGNANREFQPNKTMSRAEMAVVLDRLYDFSDETYTYPFADDSHPWFQDPVSRLYHAGITNGVEDGSKFGPTITVTREQFAVFMVRAMDESYRIEKN